MVMTLPPVFNVIGPEAVPLATVTPFTFTVAVVSATVGVTVTALLLLTTLAE